MNTLYELFKKGFCLKSRAMLFFLFLFSNVSNFSLAQENITMQQTLDYMNEKFGGKYVISINYGVVIASYFDGSEKYREDQASIKDLDTARVYYNSKTKMLIVGCANPQKKCVTREFLGKRLFYGRISFPVSYSQKTTDGLVKAFKHMIRLVNEKNYQSNEPFE